jgi:hypothetical protein
MSVRYLYYKNYFATGIFSRAIFLLFVTVNVPFKGKLLYIHFVLIMKQITLWVNYMCPSVCP